jgi:hypothetical protein
MRVGAGSATALVLLRRTKACPPLVLSLAKLLLVGDLEGAATQEIRHSSLDARVPRLVTYDYVIRIVLVHL